MKSRIIAVITATMLFSVSLNASLIPGVPKWQLDPIDTIKVVCIYALGEWSDSTKTYQRTQNTPLPSYAFDIWDTLPPSTPHYYYETSNGRFEVEEAEVWHNNGKSYVMEGYWTPMSDMDSLSDEFIGSVIARIDNEDIWSFADNAMWWPDNDNPGPNDTPMVWIFMIWPEPYGSGWGLAPQRFPPQPVDEYVDGKQVYYHIFGYSRQPSELASDAVAGVVHEFNHQWCPDIGYHPEHYGLGGFDPQAAGMGFYDDQGGLPSPLNPRWRYELGWIEKVSLGTNHHFERTIHDQTMDTVYSIDEYTVSVHRKRSHYESKWPGLGGLLVWHLQGGGDTRYGSQEAWFGDDGENYLDKPIDLEAAHGLWQWDGLSKSYADPVYGRDNLDVRGYYTLARGYKGAGDSACFFWPEYGYTQFDGLTNPSSRLHATDTGEITPQRTAIRRLQTYGEQAMKADFLYYYCIPSNYPGIHIHSGGNNQRSLVPFYSWTGSGGFHQTYAIAYVDNDPMLWIRYREDFLSLPQSNTPQQLVYQGDSASYPALYSHGTDNKQLAVCWLDGSSLYYRHGYKPQLDTLLWDENAFDLAYEFDWPGFTAPSIVVGAGDTVFIGVGVSMPQMPTGPGPTYFPVLCFRFYKWDPENVIIDTLAMHLVDITTGLGIGSSVSLAIDEHDRVHAVYQINSGDSTIAGHRYYVPGSGAWSGTVAVFTTNCYGVGSPCLGTYPGYLCCVASGLDNTHAYRNIYRTILYVGGATIPGTWNTPTLVSADTAHAWDPVTAGKNHIFWHENGELLYMDKNPDPDTTATISHTPHAWSSSPQAVYDATNGNCYVAWRESNNFGSEIDLRTISEGGSSGGGGGTQSSGKITLERISLELSNIICSDGKLDIRYTLSLPSEKALLTIYDCQGRLVRQWPVANSQGTIQWNGCDRYNRKVSSGVYFVRLACNETQIVEKTLMIK